VSPSAHDALVEAGRLFQEMAKLEGARLDAIGRGIAERLRAGARVLACGNGGSAADAQHFAAELSGRFRRDRPGLDVLALTTNASAVTAIGNDFGYERVFSRQVEAHARAGDVLLLFTTSGSSPNILAALEAGKAHGVWCLGITGLGGKVFASRCDEAIVVPSADTPRIQEVHIAIAHALCERIEGHLFGQAP
jgi:D-sedoheptulose 7-phosphate isomerase